jgi:hypothetical protein
MYVVPNTKKEVGIFLFAFLILEGSKTKSVGGRINAILRKHGIKPCNKF